MMDDHADHRKGVLLVTTLGSFLTPFMSSSVNVALPAIADEFGLDPILLSWVGLSFLLSAAVFLVPVGRLGDIHGMKKLFLAGMALYTVASLGCGLSPSAPLLIVSRALQGAGGAMLFGTGMPILISVYPPHERGKVLGINVAAVYVGLSMGPFVGGIITQHVGWRALFLWTVPIGLLFLVVAPRWLKGEWAVSRGDRFDAAGSALYAGALVALMYGFSLLPAVSGAWLVAGGLAGFWVFFRWELRTAHPVWNIRVFRGNFPFLFSNASAFINYSATFGVTFLLSLYLQYVRHLNPQDAGTILVAQPVVMALFSPLAGRLSDRIPPRMMASAGMALTSVALAFFAFLHESTPHWQIVAGLIVLGLGFALFSSPNTNAVMSSVEKQHYGIASATLGTMRLTGQMFSLGIVMLLFAVMMGPVHIQPGTQHLFLKTVRVAFLSFALLCAAGVPASLARRRARTEAREISV
ncbi:MAG: putative transport protein [Acidobacteria bacterium]|nr:putative transport protein [Acidobacteriota bacterium]